MVTPAASSTDRAELEAQRDFLLRSLDDLERERAAGDIDELDYTGLRDDYTARAATVLRALGEGGGEGAGDADDGEGSGPSPLTRRILTAAAVVAFAALAGILVAQVAGRRDAGDSLTGDIRATAAQKLNEAGQKASDGDYAGAVSLYDEVLADQPTHAEALTYSGWVLTLDGDREQGLSRLLEAATEHPDYPDAHAFLAIVFLRAGLEEEAARELEVLDGLDPPPAIRSLVEGLRAELEAAL